MKKSAFKGGFLMQKSWKILMSLFMVMLLSMSVTFAQSSYYEVQEKTLNSEFVEGKYPVVNADNILVKSRINRQITKIINDFNQNVQQENDIGRDLTGFIGYEIKANSDKIFSVIINCSTMYKGAAHPNTYAYGLSFDEQGNLIQFSQIVNVNNQTGENTYTVENLNKEIKSQVGQYLYDFFEDVKDFPQEFYLDEDMNLHVLFQRYDITPYAVGLVDVILK